MAGKKGCFAKIQNADIKRSQREAQQQPVTEEPAPKKKKQNGLSNRFKNIFNNLFD